MNRATPQSSTASSTSPAMPGAISPGSDPRAVMHDMQDKVSEMSEQARDQVMTLGAEIKDVVTRHPLATLAVTAGLAFTIGALWKLNQPRSRLDALWDALPERADLMNGRWR